MADLLEDKELALRFVYGPPALVQAEVGRLGDTYACTNLFYYVLGDHLEVAATLISMRVIRQQQFAMAAMSGNQIRRPN